MSFDPGSYGQIQTRKWTFDKAGRVEIECAIHPDMKLIVGQIKTASDAVHTAAGEIAHGNTDLSRRSELHTASLQQTATSVESLAGTVKHNAKRARQAAQLSGEASAVAGQGGEVVVQVEHPNHN